MRPINEVLRPLSTGLGMRPQLQVLRAIVVLDSVQVMYVLAGQEVASDLVLHHEDVLEDVSPSSGICPGVIGLPDHDVALVVAGLATRPSRIKFTRSVKAGCTTTRPFGRGSTAERARSPSLFRSTTRTRAMLA